VSKVAKRPRSEPQASGVRAPASKVAKRTRSGPELLWSSAQASEVPDCRLLAGSPPA
jgi:hypothetical protein